MRGTGGVLGGLLALADPSGGLRHELFYGQKVVPGSFRPGRPLSGGFVTGPQGGLGHVVLATPDLAQADRFLRGGVLGGFKKSDEIYTFIDLWFFYHCNPRHHSIALTPPMPGVRGLHHLMVEVEDFDDVGIAYDLCMSRNIPLSMTLGRHVNDRMVSFFYVRTPSGFDIEYGWDGGHRRRRNLDSRSVRPAQCLGAIKWSPKPPHQGHLRPRQHEHHDGSDTGKQRLIWRGGHGDPVHDRRMGHCGDRCGQC